MKLTQNYEIEQTFVLITLPGQKCKSNAKIMKNYAPKLYSAFKLAHCCFQKCFITFSTVPQIKNNLGYALKLNASE